MVPAQHPWEVLSALPAWQLTEVPRASQRRDEAGPDERPPGDGAVQRAAELVSAYCRSAPVAVAWVRERAGGPVRVTTAGPGLAAAADGGQHVLAMPAGGRGLPLPGGEAARLLAGIGYWTPLAGVCDVLLADPDTPGFPPGGRDGRPSLEDGLLSAWLGPFGWLLLAEPAGDGTVEELTSEAALAQLEAQRSDSPRAKLAERRAAARHQELRQAASTGLWRVHLLAGGATPEQAAQVAGLLRASSDLTAADIIEFVAEARTQYVGPEIVSAEDAELVIREVLGEDDLTDDMSTHSRGQAQTAMLVAIVRDAGLSVDEIDALLEVAARQVRSFFERQRRR